MCAFDCLDQFKCLWVRCTGGGGEVVDQVVNKEGDRDANKVAMLLNN